MSKPKMDAPRIVALVLFGTVVTIAGGCFVYKWWRARARSRGKNSSTRTGNEQHGSSAKVPPKPMLDLASHSGGETPRIRSSPCVAEVRANAQAAPSELQQLLPPSVRLSTLPNSTSTTSSGAKSSVGGNGHPNVAFATQGMSQSRPIPIRPRVLPLIQNLQRQLQSWNDPMTISPRLLQLPRHASSQPKPPLPSRLAPTLDDTPCPPCRAKISTVSVSVSPDVHVVSNRVPSSPGGIRTHDVTIDVPPDDEPIFHATSLDTGLDDVGLDKTSPIPLSLCPKTVDEKGADEKVVSLKCATPKQVVVAAERALRELLKQHRLLPVPETREDDRCQVCYERPLVITMACRGKHKICACCLLEIEITSLTEQKPEAQCPYCRDPIGDYNLSDPPANPPANPLTTQATSPELSVPVPLVQTCSAACSAPCYASRSHFR